MALTMSSSEAHLKSAFFVMPFHCPCTSFLEIDRFFDTASVIVGRI
jgi:hypothetical protein